MRTIAFRFISLFMMGGLVLSCASTPSEIAARHAKRGDEYAQKEKYPEAVIEYQNAVKAGPNDGLLRWKLAKSALESKNLGLAFRELKKAVELDPNNYEAAEKLGEIYLLGGKTEEAARIADNLVVSWPKAAEGYKLKSALAFRSGKIDEAVLQAKKASALVPNDHLLMLTVGNFYLIKRDRKSALEWYDKALVASPNVPEVHIARGNFFFASGERVEGEKEYRKAIELSKNKENLRIVLADHYLYQGRMDESEKELNLVIKEMDSQKARKRLAEIKLETGRVGEAKTIVDEILKKNEKDIDGKFLKGRIALLEKRPDDAKVLFGEAIKQDAGMARAHLYNGITDIYLGQIESGKKEVLEAVRLDPGDAKARIVLGDLYLKSNDPTAAEKEALEVLRNNPANIRAAVIYGDSFLLRKEWGKAEQVYRSMIRQMPKNPLGYYKMGIAKNMQGNLSESADFFAQSIKLNPKDTVVINDYLFTLVAAKQGDKAKMILDGYLVEEPRNPMLWEIAGRFYLRTGKPDEAERALLKAVELTPEFFRPYYELAVMYMRQQRLPEAESKFRKALKLNEKNVSTLVLLGTLMNLQGKIEDANGLYRKALTISPRTPLAANNLAANLTEHGGNLDEALKFAQVAREVIPEEPNVADTLGWIYYKKGMIDTAYPLISEAARKLAKNPVVRYHHGMILEKKGNLKEAASELKVALSLDSNFPGAEEAKKTLENMRQ